MRQLQAYRPLAEFRKNLLSLVCRYCSQDSKWLGICNRIVQWRSTYLLVDMYSIYASSDRAKSLFVDKIPILYRWMEVRLRVVLYRSHCVACRLSTNSRFFWAPTGSCFCAVCTRFLGGGGEGCFTNGKHTWRTVVLRKISVKHAAPIWAKWNCSSSLRANSTALEKRNKKGGKSVP